MTSPVPDGLEGRVIPYLMVDGASAAIEFYTEAFDAEEVYRLGMPGGQIGHAEITINGASVYLADAPDDMAGNAGNPNKLRGTSVVLTLYVDDVDSTVEKAVAAGAELLREPTDQFYGDRMGVIEDPFGHQWSLHTHIRDVSPEQMVEAMAEMTPD